MKYKFMILKVESAGKEEMAALERLNGKLPSSPTLQGPYDEIYRFFRMPENEELAAVTKISDNITVYADGIYDSILPESILRQAQASMDTVSDGQHRFSIQGLLNRMPRE